MVSSNFPNYPYRLEENCWLRGQDIGANTSNYGGELWIRKNSGTGRWTSNSNSSFTFHLNGSQVAGWNFSYDFRGSDSLRLCYVEANIGHNADGTKTFSIDGYANVEQLGYTEVHSSIAAPTIPRASTASFPNGNWVEAGSSIYASNNRASSSFTHDTDYYFGSTSGRAATGTGADFNWTAPLSLLNQIPNATSGTGKIRTHTYNGGTMIGWTETIFGLTAGASIIPTWTGTPTIAENAAGVAAIVGSGRYLQGISKLKGTIAGAAGVYGSTITSQTHSVSGETVSGAVGTFVNPLPTAGTSVPVTQTITDTRGRQKTLTTNINVLPYSQPVIPTFGVERVNASNALDPVGTRFKVSVIGAVQSIINTTERNRLTLRVFTKLKTASTWSAATNIVVDSTTLSYNASTYLAGPFDVASAWDVKVEMVDKFNTTVAQTQVGTGSVFQHWSTGLGLGKYWENGMLDVSGNVHANASGSMKGEFISAGGFYAGDVRVVTNWDSANKVGVYRAAAGATNAPYATDSFVGDVYASGTVLIQELISATVAKPSLRFTRIYNGSTWGKWSRSDGLMIPTNVNNGTYDPATGRINLTAGTKKWDVDGCFTTDFRAYRIQFQWYTGTANGAGFRLRTGGVENATSNYQYEAVYATGTGTPAAILGVTTQATFPPNSAQGFFGYVVVSEPMYTAGNSNQKRFESQWGSWGSAQVAQVNASLGNHDTVAFDGFSIYQSDQSAGQAGIAAGSHAWLSVQAIA